MKGGQKGTIQKTLQRLIRGGLLKTAIKLSVDEATIKDWKKYKNPKSAKVSKFRIYLKQSETANQISPLYFIQK